MQQTRMKSVAHTCRLLWAFVLVIILDYSLARLLLLLLSSRFVLIKRLYFGSEMRSPDCVPRAIKSNQLLNLRALQVCLHVQTRYCAPPVSLSS